MVPSSMVSLSFGIVISIGICTSYETADGRR
jgi:hypothetical protein